MFLIQITSALILSTATSPIPKNVFAPVDASREEILKDDENYNCQRTAVGAEVCIHRDFSRSEKTFLITATEHLISLLPLNRQLMDCLVAVDNKFPRLGSVADATKSIIDQIIDRKIDDQPKPPKWDAIVFTPFQRNSDNSTTDIAADTTFAYPDFYSEMRATSFPYYSVGINQDLLSHASLAIGHNRDYWAAAIFTALLINEGFHTDDGDSKELILPEAAACLLFNGAVDSSFNPKSIEQHLATKAGDSK